MGRRISSFPAAIWLYFGRHNFKAAMDEKNCGLIEAPIEQQSIAATTTTSWFMVKNIFFVTNRIHK
jgi:hypothetical protein